MSIKQKLQSITVLNDLYTRWKWRQRKVSYGSEYPDLTFFVIRRAYCKVGLFSYVMTGMGLVDYAVKMGYIPVIDLQNGRNTYLDDAKIGKENAWEYYFKQPCGYSLKDIDKAQNVILSSGLITEENDYPDFRITENEELFTRWHEVFQKYFHVSDEIMEEFQELRQRYLGKQKVLGILARGTDYVASKPKGHPVQPSVEQMIQKAEEVMEAYSCEKIYLATEDADIYAGLKAHFGELLVAPDTDRYTTGEDQNINDLRANQDKFVKGKEYLLSMMLLAECSCLVAGNVGGTHGALLMSKGYEYRYIFNLGNYGDEE